MSGLRNILMATAIAGASVTAPNAQAQSPEAQQQAENPNRFHAFLITPDGQKIDILANRSAFGPFEAEPNQFNIDRSSDGFYGRLTNEIRKDVRSLYGFNLSDNELQSTYSNIARVLERIPNNTQAIIEYDFGYRNSQQDMSVTIRHHRDANGQIWVTGGDAGVLVNSHLVSRVQPSVAPTAPQPLNVQFAPSVIDGFANAVSTQYIRTTNQPLSQAAMDAVRNRVATSLQAYQIGEQNITLQFNGSVANCTASGNVTVQNVARADGTQTTLGTASGTPNYTATCALNN